MQLSLKNDTFGVSPSVQLEHGQADLEETLAELPLALVEVTRKLVEEGASKANSPSASMTAGHRRGQSISLQVGGRLGRLWAPGMPSCVCLHCKALTPHCHGLGDWGWHAYGDAHPAAALELQNQTVHP
jgi:hypothetical protein